MVLISQIKYLFRFFLHFLRIPSLLGLRIIKIGICNCLLIYLTSFSILDPNPVARLTPLVDATNVTLTWERPAGRVDMYRLVWFQADSDPVSPVPSSTSSSTTSLPDDSRRRRKRQSDPPQKRSVVVQGDSNHSYIDTLFPGTLYVVEMTSISFGVESNKTSLTLRTRKTF